MILVYKRRSDPAVERRAGYARTAPVGDAGSVCESTGPATPQKQSPGPDGPGDHNQQKGYTMTATSVDHWIDDDAQPVIRARRQNVPSHESWTLKVCNSSEMRLGGLTIYLRRPHLAAAVRQLRAAADVLEADIAADALQDAAESLGRTETREAVAS